MSASFAFMVPHRCIFTSRRGTRTTRPPRLSHASWNLPAQRTVSNTENPTLWP